MTRSDEPEPTCQADRGVAVTRSEEELRLSTRSVPVERVRLSKRIVTYTETRTVQIRREELVVVREPVGDKPDASSQDGEKELEVVLHREELEITKRVVPYERVRISKTTGAPQQLPVTAELAKEQVVVETDQTP